MDPYRSDGGSVDSFCLSGNSKATPKFKTQSHWAIKAQSIMNKYERLQKGKKKDMHNRYLCFSLATERELWFRHTEV